MKYFLTSWKMYRVDDHGRPLLKAIQAGLRERVESGVELPRLIICPSFISLVPIREVADDQLVALGAQNCHHERDGAYTGEVSAEMLKGLVEYVLVGHSERRAAGETDEQIAKKVAAACEAGLVPILLVGEDDKGGDAIEVTERRLREDLSEVDPTSQKVVVVYEPTWAIGGDETAPPGHIRRGVEHLKGVLRDLGVAEPELIYGGSVNEDNVGELVELADVLDGIGAGRASLDAERLLKLIDAVSGGSTAGGAGGAGGASG